MLPAAMRARTLVIDYDATITEDDVLNRVAVEFGGDDDPAGAGDRLDGRELTLHEVLRIEYAGVRATREEVVAWVLANARLRAGFHELVAMLQRNGWPLIILSSGFHTLIEPVLERERLTHLRLIANDVDPSSRGWRVRFRDESMCAVCGESCKRRTLASLGITGELIYVGDGYSDRCAALAADRVFARSGLAHYLAARDVPFETFETFHEIATALEA